MKPLFFITSLLISSNILANSKYAERLVINEIEQYAHDYQIEELDLVKYIGIINKKYTFNVSYKKNFCTDIGDDERNYCATYNCKSIAEVDSDAVVSFETESNVANCKKIPGTDFTVSW